jgi:Protein of unknown function (DUF1084)
VPVYTDVVLLSPHYRYGLAIGYGAIALVAAVQLIRIQMRVPEYGWTTQKVFHLLNFLVASLRLGVFACWKKVGGGHPYVLPRGCVVSTRQHCFRLKCR